MLLSEAIEKGSVGRKCCNGEYFDQNGGCCVLGAAALAIGYEVTEQDFDEYPPVSHFLRKNFPILVEKFGEFSLQSRVVMWNNKGVEDSSILAAIKEFEKEQQPPAPDAHALGEREE